MQALVKQAGAPSNFEKPLISGLNSAERALQRDGTTSEAFSRALNQLGTDLVEAGRYPEARRLREQELRIDQQLHGEEHPNVANSMSNLAYVMRAQGDLTAARELNEKTLELRRRLLGEEHPLTLGSKADLTRWAVDDNTQSPADAQRALAVILRQILASTTPISEHPVEVGRLLREVGGDPVAVIREVAGDQDAQAYAALLDGPEYPSA